MGDTFIRLHLGVPAARHPADEAGDTFLGRPRRHLQGAPLAAWLDGDEDVANSGVFERVSLPQRYAVPRGKGQRVLRSNCLRYAPMQSAGSLGSSRRT